MLWRIWLWNFVWWGKMRQVISIICRVYLKFHQLLMTQTKFCLLPPCDGVIYGWRHLWMTLSYNRESTSKQRTFKQILISLLHCFKADIFTEFLTRLTTIIGISLILIVLLPLETSLKRRKLNEMMKVIRRPLFSTGYSGSLWLSKKCSTPEMENFLS